MQTGRLVLRNFLPTDAGDFAKLIRDKMSSEFAACDEQYPTDDASLNGILSYFASTDEFIAVTLKSGELIGYAALNRVDDATRNMGYCLRSELRNNGYAFEAAAAAVEYAASALGAKKLISATATVNTPSVKLLQKLGFTATGESSGSFCNDENGRPITFACREYKLDLTGEQK